MRRPPRSSAPRSRTGRSSRASPRQAARHWPASPASPRSRAAGRCATCLPRAPWSRGRNACPRVAAPGKPGTGDAAALSRALAALRRAAGLSQPALAALAGYSTTTVGHAETGRLWQARAFWEKADIILAADGELTRRHDAYRAGLAGPALAPSPPAAPRPQAVTRVTLHWDDGTTSVLYPPAAT